ncbi:hypothetical protein [Saccharomonospora glauca]|jgi:hypothetical protein|uniref:Uncharacterized protein n=1 Tax=Saccharomonospora glauca K62 TaxID=928724 RepID=I1D1K3_9PSEU|nr:hypothetical protein [Saccharomonospora glauca]EIE98827.1 hypothetical protein SacglDRAFT_01917 [Saccharomonospora glauca K62]
MKRGAQTAAAVIAGYLLGRTKKMRLALMIAAAGATGKHGTNPTGLLRAGLSRLGDSAELSRLTDSVRGELLEAARAAATKAATSRIESLSQRITEGSGDEDRDSSGDEEEASEPEEEPPEEPEPPRRPGVRRRSRGATEEDGGSPPRRRRSASEGNRRPARRRSPSSADSTENTPDDGDSEDSPDRPRTRARTSAGRSPVRRSGR